MFGRFPKFTRCQTSAGEFHFFFAFWWKIHVCQTQKISPWILKLWSRYWKEWEFIVQQKSTKVYIMFILVDFSYKKGDNVNPHVKNAKAKNEMEIEDSSYKYLLVPRELLGRSHWASTSFLFELRIFRHALYKC